MEDLNDNEVYEGSEEMLNAMWDERESYDWDEEYED